MDNKQSVACIKLVMNEEQQNTSLIWAMGPELARISVEHRLDISCYSRVCIPKAIQLSAQTAKFIKSQSRQGQRVGK